MKTNISILGSTGSIGETSLNIIKKKNHLFKVHTLVANSNLKKILDQIRIFKPINFVVVDKDIFIKVKNKTKNSKTKIFNKYNKLIKGTKIDITICAIPGLEGLNPTIEFAKISKKILLANKESIICGWNILSRIAKKNNTKIEPIDSEHFSIKKIMATYRDNDIEKIYITASGGPFFRTPISKFKKIKPADAIKHPKWKMGKKISVDSATLMNKILELIEAQKIFKYEFKKYELIIHPQSLVHAIIKFKNGITKLLYHEPDMTIPISNAIFNFDVNISDFVHFKKKEVMRNLEFCKVDARRYPVFKLIPLLNRYNSTPIIINAANEILVDQFLKNKISFCSISKYLFLLLKDKNYKKYAIQRPINLKSIYKIDNWSRNSILKIISEKKLI